MSPSSPCHSLDGATGPVGDDAHGRADGTREVGASLERCVSAVDGARLLDVQRLAGGDADRVIDDDDRRTCPPRASA